MKLLLLPETHALFGVVAIVIAIGVDANRFATNSHGLIGGLLVAGAIFLTSAGSRYDRR